MKRYRTRVRFDGLNWQARREVCEETLAGPGSWRSVDFMYCGIAGDSHAAAVACMRRRWWDVTAAEFDA